MAYPRGHFLLAYLCLVPLDAATVSFHFDFFNNPADLYRKDLLYINDSVASGDRIDLTRIAIDSAGRVAYAQPVRLWDSSTSMGASFTTSFTFAIGGNYNNTRGDGMTFFVGMFPPSQPPSSQAWRLGLVNDPAKEGSPPIVGVEFDTVFNDLYDPPNVTDHIGINVNSLHSTVYTTDLPNLSLYGTMWANVTYDASTKMMAVGLRLADRTSTHNIQTMVDFKAAGVPQDAAVGFSAATGGLMASHQLLSWSFSSTDIAGASRKTQPWVIQALIAVCAVLGAGLLAALLYIFKRPKWGEKKADGEDGGAGEIRTERNSDEANPDSPISCDDDPVAREFSYDELVLATKKFSEILGTGSFGQVFRGDLPEGSCIRQVAVKRLNEPTEQTMRDYVTEIVILGNLDHDNLVKLVGWADGDGQNDTRPLLVYELMANRSVDKHLHEGRMHLPWEKRYKIAIQVGRAIEYLHTGLNNLIILHRDIKPSNVMLDAEFEAKLGDFGLVRRMSPGQSSHGTAMFGSCSYMDPSCVTTGTVSTASDMYSYGVLLLELATGKKPSLLQGEGSFFNSLVGEVQIYYNNNNVLEKADQRLREEYHNGQMERMLVVGLLCTQRNRQDRLEIRQALSLLSNLDHPVPQTGEGA